MPRRHAEVWIETRAFNRVAVDSLVRCVQRLNGQKSFYVGLVIATKRAPRPYRLGKKLVEMSLQLRTSVGTRLAGLDTLSNDAPSEAELQRFKVPLNPVHMRKHMRKVQAAMSEHAEKFDEQDLQRRAEEEERLRRAREAEEEAERAADEERERKGREREEMRRRAADKAAGGGAAEPEQWWLSYNVTRGDASGREVAKWRARLLRFEKIAKATVAGGERENALRLAAQAFS